MVAGGYEIEAGLFGGDAKLDQLRRRELLVVQALQPAGDEPGQDAFDAELRYRGAPYEVSYVVASWRRAP